MPELTLHAVDEGRERAAEAIVRDREARDARLAAGLGFWRLVMAIAVGILIAQAIAAFVGGLLTGPFALR